MGGGLDRRKIVRKEIHTQKRSALEQNNSVQKQSDPQNKSRLVLEQNNQVWQIAHLFVAILSIQVGPK